MTILVTWDSKVIQEMKDLGLNKISFNRKRDRIMDCVKNLLNIHKYNKNKKTMELSLFSKEFCFDKDLFIETTS